EGRELAAQVGERRERGGQLVVEARRLRGEALFDHAEGHREDRQAPRRRRAARAARPPAREHRQGEGGAGAPPPAPPGGARGGRGAGGEAGGGGVGVRDAPVRDAPVRARFTCHVLVSWIGCAISKLSSPPGAANPSRSKPRSRGARAARERGRRATVPLSSCT